MIRRVYGCLFSSPCQLKLRSNSVICEECYLLVTALTGARSLIIA
jgi:hypothetical protein